MATIRGGDKLQNALAKIASKLGDPRTLRVGFLEKATYPDGTKVALIAAVHNYGAPSRGIPPRPFFSNMVKDNQGEWPAVVVQALKATDYNVEKALAMVGEHIKGQLQEAINNFEGVPLKDSTVKRKGFDKQLIHTSHMLNSADYEVKK